MKKCVDKRKLTWYINQADRNKCGEKNFKKVFKKVVDKGSKV